jgi:ubiquinone/menaquinone biosynthesis C-methylase UbiE
MTDSQKQKICKICNGQQHKNYTAMELVYGTKKSFNFFLCNNCGCLQMEKIPKEIADYYPEDFYSYTKKSRKKDLTIKTLIRKARSRYILDGNGISGLILHRLKKTSALLETCREIGIKTSHSVLDVGGGTGDFVWQLRSYGITDSIAIDKFINEDVYVEGKLLAKKTDIFSIDKQFDIITFHHSLEHMEEQQEPLLHAKKILKPNGTILLRIPTVTSYAWEKYGVNWWGMDTPRHFFLHSHASIKLLVEQVGLKIKKLWSDSTVSQFWVSEQNLQGISIYAHNSYGVSPEKSIFAKSEIDAFERQTANVNQKNRGDTICIILKHEDVK